MYIVCVRGTMMTMSAAHYVLYLNAIPIHNMLYIPYIYLYTSGRCSCCVGNIAYIYIGFLEATRVIRAIKKEIWPAAAEPSGRRLPISTSIPAPPPAPNAGPHHFHRLSNDVVSTFAPPRNFPVRKRA